MTAPDFALRFDFPGGLALDVTGRAAACAGAEAIRRSILMLLSTIPGERLMRPDYGCDLFRLAFAPNDETTAGMAMHYVRSAVSRFEPRVAVESVDAGSDPDRSEVLQITLTYRIKQSGVADRLDYAFHLSMEGAN